MNTREKVSVLAVICTRDHSGRHFTEIFNSVSLDELERENLIEIHRPVHESTEIPYSQEYWSVMLTDEGQALVDAFPECWPEDQ